MSAFTDAVARLKTFFNGSNYNASTNPGGFANDGHRVNFVPALQDVGTVGQGAADAAAAAAGSATAASGSATTANTKAGESAASATASASSATSASGSAGTATTKAAEASTSATASAASATSAAGSATAASGSATAASGSASTASSAATSSGTSATAAAGSATAAVGSATAAATSETNAAASAAKLVGSSTTSVAIGTGSKSFTTQSGKFFAVGADVLVTSDANPTTSLMRGQVTAYSGTGLTVNVVSAAGTGTASDWTIRVSGASGVNGLNGWTAVTANIADGARRVQQVVDWFGGSGTKPTVGLYLSTTGYTATIGDATDIRGAAGAGSGDVSTTGGVTAGHMAIFTDGTGDSIQDGGAVPTLSSLGGQPLDATLTAFAGATIAADTLAYGSGSDAITVTPFTAAARALLDDSSASVMRTTLGLAIGSDVQAYDVELAAWAALVSAANKLGYFTGSGTAAVTDFTAFARTLLGDADAAAMRTTLGLGTAAVVNTGASSGNVPVLDGSGKLVSSVLPAIAITDVYEVASQAAMLALTAERGDIAIRTDLNKTFALATDSPSTLADWKELRTPTDVVLAVAGLTGTITASSLRSALSLVVGTDVQAYDADLAAIAALTTTSYGRSFLALADAAGALTLIGLAKAAGSDIRTGTDDAKYLTAKSIRDAMAFVALTDASTIAIDMAAGFNFSVTLGGNRTLGAPTNSIAGQSGLILITQDGTGSRTLSYNAAWKFAGGAPTASTAAGTADAIAYTVTTGGGSPVVRATYIKAFA